MSLRRVIATIGCLASVATPASSKPLQPTEKWHVFFDQRQCLAQRNYGTASDPVYLILKQPPLGDVMQVAVGIERDYTSATEFDGSVTFGSKATHKVSFLIYGPTKQNFRFYTANLPLADMAEARSADSVRIAVQELDRTFAISDVGELLSVMDSCVADLRKYWNISENSQKTVARSARGNLQGLFSPDDYPSAALRHLEKGPVKVALLINEQGRVADCSVIETSGVAALDAQACATLTARAKFTPAVGKDGKPARDSYVQTIVWQLQ